ncbi:MAG: ABC transporter permease [Chloroflexota bacterium]|nr:ABC transporter permease [Chloroflexia bacterium]MDQ3227198.1 ABC transporter permease [Chloroflexota bacterium]
MTHGANLEITSAPAGTSPSASEHGANRVAELALPGLPVRDLRVKEQRSLWGNAWRQFRKHKLAMVGLVLFVFMLLATFVGSPLYPQDIDTIDFMVSDTGVSWAHPFGADSLGRDILARILWGGRISLAVGIVAALVSILLGTAIGAIAGFFGGVTDTLLMRFTDLFISLPQVPLLLVISFLYRDAFYGFFEDRTGTGVTGIFVLIVLVIGVLSWMPTARLVRASFLATKQKEFVEAAESMGATRSSQIFRHILPNVLSPIIVAATLGVGAAIITESALSFLGLGFPSNVPTWGSMLLEAKDRLEIAPHEALFPGMMIFLTVLSINYVGDGLRDALDPRKTS